MLKVGVIGLGTVSIVHIRGIEQSDMVELTALADIDPSKAIGASKVPFYTDYKEMIAKENLDVVHICLPHYLHDEVTAYCVENGVHVFLEKPISVDFLRSKKLLENVNAHPEVKVGVCFQNRLNQTVIDLKRILKNQNSKIIAVKGLVAWYRPETYYTEKNKTWRGTWEGAGSGTIINQAIHTLDLMRYITEVDWTECKAMVGNLLDYDIEVEDTSVANFTFEKGIKGLYFSTNAYYGNDSVELQVVTERTRYTIKDNKLFDDSGNFISEDASLPDSKIYYGPGHSDAMNQFYKAIIDKSDHYIKLEEAIQTMEMVDAMKVSSTSGEIVKREDILNG